LYSTRRKIVVSTDTYSFIVHAFRTRCSPLGFDFKYNKITGSEYTKRVSYMLMSLEELAGFSMRAKDGEIGKVNDFYFDEKEWTVRYLVDKTGFWLSRRQVIISPACIDKIDLENKQIITFLTRDQVEHSPRIDLGKPLARDDEEKIINYYRWPDYTSLTKDWMQWRDMEADRQATGPNLHSSQTVKGYHIMTAEGELGFVENLIVDDKSWTIRYLVIDAVYGLDGKKILVAPDWIDAISWSERYMAVKIEKEKMRACPNFDLSIPIRREYEELLYEHYECKKYWE
jgi:sporulation protein YlmC with PRC-barrel domain